MANRDESYVIDLFDRALGIKAERQYRGFSFLVADKGPKRPKGTRLPVDAYYKSLSLVIEYRERQHFEAVKFFDKPHKLTVSGVSRREQRKIYDQRRRDLLPKHGIKLLEVSYETFSHNKKKRLIRVPEQDLLVVKKLLKGVIK